MSDPIDKEKQIKKYRNMLFDLFKTKPLLKRSNFYIMDETALCSDAVVSYTWTSYDDDEAYIRSFGVKRRDTLVATLRADGEGFGWFIEHKT